MKQQIQMSADYIKSMILSGVRLVMASFSMSGFGAVVFSTIVVITVD